MSIYFGGQEYSKAYIGGSEISGLVHGGNSYLTSVAPAPIPDATLSRTLDRSFGITPTSGGGNVSPDTFVYNNQNWELWQAIPFLASVGEQQRGDARIQFRNRSIGRGAMTLASLPAVVVMSGADWTGLPWIFTRPTANNKYGNVGNGQNARVRADYERPIATRTVTPASLGIAQGESFTVDIYWTNPFVAPAGPPARYSSLSQINVPSGSQTWTFSNLSGGQLRNLSQQYWFWVPIRRRVRFSLTLNNSASTITMGVLDENGANLGSQTTVAPLPTSLTYSTPVLEPGSYVISTGIRTSTQFTTATLTS